MDKSLSGYWLHHASISVPDLSAAIDFYRGLFGLTVERTFTVDDIPAHGALLSGNALRLELWQTLPGGEVPKQRRRPHDDLHEGGTKHLGFAVSHLSEQLTRLRSARVRVVASQARRGEPMRLSSDGSVPEDPFAVFIADPFGTLIELLDADQIGPDPIGLRR